MCDHHAVLKVGDGPLGVCRECGTLVPVQDEPEPERTILGHRIIVTNAIPADAWCFVPHNVRAA